MKSVVDASFLITCPDFRINDTDAAKWIIGGENLPNDVNSHVYFGDKKMHKTYNLISNTKDESWTGRTEPHQAYYGQYFYCYTKGLRGFTFYQDVKVTQGRMVPAAMQRIQHSEQFGEHQAERQSVSKPVHYGARCPRQSE